LNRAPRDLWKRHETLLGILVVTLSVGAALASFLAYLRVARLYREIGRSGRLWLENGEAPPETREAIRQEVREMLEALASKRGDPSAASRQRTSETIRPGSVGARHSPAEVTQQTG
jgi:hypothetical protein